MQIYPFPVMPTRPCAFCLCLQDGRVFADFDFDAEGLVSLRRISFDGYGCCKPTLPTQKINLSDSVQIRSMVDSHTQEQDGVEYPEIEQILRNYFKANFEVLWEDALKDHELV
ncbi:hypothetical protein [Undibacterium curvum]|uniref:Uncharacterized protein n=1 Tax=Undibacterium curvum TaxID=2762294 RepID=A0ABR7A0G2_9BURK|nr:hypothetical protein [Undibacterium curvum]MBC3930401.1 hypothetical protein [Undibacterium curvum]